MDRVRKLRSSGEPTTADMAKDNVAQELKKLTSKIDEMNGNIRKELNSKVDQLQSTIQKNQGQVLAELSKQGREIRAHMDLEIGRLEARIDTLEGKIEGGSDIACKPRFDPDVSIIISGLSEDGDEDLQLTVLRLLSGLGSEAVPVAVERIRSRGRGPGLVKAEFSSVEEKVAILRNKQKLRDQEEFAKVFMRSAKSHTDRLIEINFKTLLKEIPGGADYFVAGNGRIRRREKRSERTGYGSDEPAHWSAAESETRPHWSAESETAEVQEESYG